MHDEESFRSLETRLRDESHQLLGDSPHTSLIANLRGTFVHRRRHHVLVQILCTTAAIATVGLIGTSWNQRPHSEIEISTDSQAPATDVAQGLTSYDERLPRVQTDASDPGTPQFKAIAILFLQTDQEGELEFASGWYSPEQVQAIDAADLSPAERHAISRLLGPDFEISDDETI